MASARPGHEPAPVACCLLLAAGLAGGPVWQTARRTPPLGSTDRQGVGQAQRWRRQTPGSAGRPADRLSPRSLEAEHGLPACKATQTSGVGEDLPCSISADLDWKTVVPRRRRTLRACRPPPSSSGRPNHGHIAVIDYSTLAVVLGQAVDRPATHRLADSRLELTGEVKRPRWIIELNEESQGLSANRSPIQNGAWIQEARLHGDFPARSYASARTIWLACYAKMFVFIVVL